MVVKTKQMLCDIIDVAFADADENTRDIYKDFSIEMSNRALKTKLGDYSAKDRKIRIFNLQQETQKQIVITAIHEASHHIDYMQRNTTGHDAAFYTIHRRLMFTACDMGILSAEEARSHDDSHARNGKKISSMMHQYSPNPISYKEDESILVVFSPYSYKHLFANRGYSWNSIKQFWFKTVDDAIDEIKYLKNFVSRDDIKIMKGGNNIPIKVEKPKRIYLVGDTARYEHKLRRLGYLPQGNIWTKECLPSSYNEEQQALEALSGVHHHFY